MNQGKRKRECYCIQEHTETRRDLLNDITDCPKNLGLGEDLNTTPTI